MVGVSKSWAAWLPKRRRAARVRTAELVAQARKALSEFQKLEQTARITGHADDYEKADSARSHCQEQWFAIGDAMRALPTHERELVAIWDHAAAMTWWHRTSDRHGWACFEAAAAQVIAALPEGVESAAVVAVIAANARRCEIELHRCRDAVSNTPCSSRTERTDQHKLVMLLRANLIEVRTDESGSARAGEALRHFEPWLRETVAELDRPQSQDRLNEIVRRWRGLREQFFWHVGDRVDPTQVSDV
jgi:hypothetical protein